MKRTPFHPAGRGDMDLREIEARRYYVSASWLVLAFLPLLSMPSAGQTTGSSSCRLERVQLADGNDRSGFSPVLSGPFANSAIESQLSSAYRSLPVRPPVQVTRDNLSAALALARLHSNRCAEALAAYGLGVFFRNTDIAASSDWFHQAETAFRDAGSATGLAHVHFELAALSNNAKAQDDVAAGFESAAGELERIGDPIDALSARLQAVNLSASDAAMKLEQLIAQARDLHSPALEARIHQIWGDSLFTRGQYDQAMLHYRRSDQLFVSCHCDFDERAYLQTSMGRLERTQGRPEAAIPHYRLALSLQKLAHDQSFIPQTLNALSVAYFGPTFVD